MPARFVPGLLALAALHLMPARADVYLHSPRGSNNKLREQSNNVQNDNRLFDSQNNAQGGYQVGDNCRPNCLNGGAYNPDKEGAMQGVMTFYKGSELYIEWTNQHGCGEGHPNVHCQVVLQYMCDSDNPSLRDGTTQKTAGGGQEPPNADSTDATQGQHESLEYYQACRSRERNGGLYNADQNVRDDRGATATRQNPNGNGNAGQRHGFECPEERDYYPYWHPSPWHDIAILTDEPQLRCPYYRSESQNVKAKGFCSEGEFNNPAACSEGAGEWRESPAFEEPPPLCRGGVTSRDNHLGNVRNGHPAYYLWEIPRHVQGRCVLRIRYNVTTNDFDRGSEALPHDEGAEVTGSLADHFFLDARYNDQDGRTGQYPPILISDPTKDFLGLGDKLQLQVSTNQYGRVFEDRTHAFLVRERPDDIPSGARIVNYNVRGRRGNIVQVYPSVEYDFVPAELAVEQGTYLHFQWTGSDANQQNNAGNGRKGTDRSNLVQLSARGETVPIPLERQTLLFDAVSDPDDVQGRDLVKRFAFLDQRANVECDDESGNDNADDNCKQLNGASAYFNGGLVRMDQLGEHHIGSTRNNDFSNRSQQATIRVVAALWAWYAGLALGFSLLLIVAGFVYLAAAWYALTHPACWLFSTRYRPRVLAWLMSSARIDHAVAQRRELLRAAGEKWAAGPGKAGDVEVPDMAIMVQPGGAPRTSLDRCLWCCMLRGWKQKHLTILFYAGLNVLVFAIGFLSYLGDGFKGSLAYPVAKGFGFSLDLNFSMVVLPTLKTLQTALRRISGSREWVPIDDPIAFHKAVAYFILLGSFGHIAAHVAHMRLVSEAAPIQPDPLHVWALTAEEQVSGMPWWEQALSERSRFAAVTGFALLVLMIAMFITATRCVRRGTNCCTRRLGGYNLFWRMHMSWKWVYVLLLLHAPARLWIWLFFPALLIAADRLLLSQRQRLDATLLEVKLLPRDVISLTFEVPPGFTYQAGQYILLGWRGEWHPFTLTSAPEERVLAVHIRAPNNLDWCSALRRRLTEEAPQAATGVRLDKPTQGTVIKYSKRVHSRHELVYNRPTLAGLAAGKEGKRVVGKPLDGEDTEGAGPPSTSVRSVSEESLPEDAVVMQLTGPFGAPAQKVWQFETLMVVGAGIGATPFASILRSVQLRARQREAILGAARRRKSARDEHGSLGKLLEDAVAVPKRIYFYWIVRSQDEFDWFYDLLVDAAEGPAQGIINITLFITGEADLSKVRKLPCANGQFFGRPNWERIFKQNRESHAGEHIGVFLCGSSAIGAELGRQSAKHTDPPGQPGVTRFSFFKEHF